MSNLTRRFKNNKKNKTMRRGGASEEGEFKERRGVIDILGNTAKDVASIGARLAADTALNFVGLERKKIPMGEEKVVEDTAATNYDPSIYANRGKIDISPKDNENKEPGLLCTVLDVVDRTGGLIISDLNEVLASDQFKKTTEEAGKETAALIKENAQRFNEALDNPEVKAQLEEAIKKAGEISEMVVKYGEKPYYRAVDIAGRAAQKASSAAVSGSLKVGADAISAIPFLGSVVSVGNMINDTSKAASALVEAGSEVVQSGSDVFLEIKRNIEKDYNLDSLEEKKKLGQQIYNRVNKSISDFQNSKMGQQISNKVNKTMNKFQNSKIGQQISNRVNKTMSKFQNQNSTQSVGGHKTRRRTFNHNAK